MSIVFRIPLRHKRTGNELHFDDRQSLADFFVTHPRADYEGWENLGKLPAPTAQAVAEAIEAGDDVLEGLEDLHDSIEVNSVTGSVNGQLQDYSLLGQGAPGPAGDASTAESNPDHGEQIAAGAPGAAPAQPVVDPDATLPGTPAAAPAPAPEPGPEAPAEAPAATPAPAPSEPPAAPPASGADASGGQVSEGGAA